MYCVRIWSKIQGTKVKRFNGGSWFAELIGEQLRSYKTISTFSLTDSRIIEVIQPVDYLDKILHEDLCETSEWSYSEVSNVDDLKDISDLEKEKISKWLEKEDILDVPISKPLVSREKTLPSRKPPAHISGRLMIPCFI